MECIRDIKPRPYWRAAILLLALTLLLSAGAIYIVPFSKPMAIFYQEAQELLATGRIESDLVGVGYPVFLALCIKLGGLNGIFVGQSILYITSAMLGFIILLLLGSSRTTAFLGAALLSGHAYLLLNIKRIVENNLTVPLLLAFCLIALWVNKKGVNYARIILWGCALGLLAATRANALSLLVTPFIFLPLAKPCRILKHIPKLLTFALFVYLVIYSLTITAKGRALFIPTHGVGNFYMGANDNTYRSLLLDYNAEIGAGADLASKGIVLSRDSKEQQEQLFRLAWQYVSRHPGRYAALCLLKFFNLFRPDYRQVRAASTIDSPLAKTAVQTLLAAPFLLWFFLVIRTSAAGIKSESWPLLPIVIFYALPFIIICSEPRYRLPIDAVIILDSVYRFTLLRRIRKPAA